MQLILIFFFFFKFNFHALPGFPQTLLCIIFIFFFRDYYSHADLVIWGSESDLQSQVCTEIMRGQIEALGGGEGQG